MAGITTNASIASFGGRFLKLTHQSAVTGGPMNFTLFLPAGISADKPAPLLIYLSGLTCTPDNVTEKGFLHAHAAPLKLALLYPDTSPRGSNHPGEHDSWDFGSAASFYIDATQKPWASNYRMETYITKELPEVVFANFKELDPQRVSISGHSMGGHGALTLFLKNPGKYHSVSAFSPVSNPSACPWGEKAFAAYLGDDREAWKKHDATELVRHWKGHLNALLDVVCLLDMRLQDLMLMDACQGHGGQLLQAATASAGELPGCRQGGGHPGRGPAIPRGVFSQDGLLALDVC